MKHTTPIAFMLCGMSLLFADSARAQAWPPVNAEERGNSQTTRVLGVPFTTGYFSYWIRAYRADKVHYTKTNYSESWSWRRGVGPDGVITSAPDKLKIGPFQPLAPTASSTPLPPVTPLQSVPLPSLPPLPQVRPLSQIRPLKPLSSNQLPAIPPLSQPSNSLPTLPRLNS